MIAILKSPRLLLRWFEPEDAAFVLELINQPAWIAGVRDAGVRTDAAAREWLQSRLIDPCWQHGHGFWLVQRRHDAEPLGMCGVFKRDSLPMPDLGYGFLQRHWGQGYAREAARACMDYAVQVLDRNALMAITSPSNEASQNLLRELGFVAEGEPTESADGPTQHWHWQMPASAQAPSLDDAAQLDALVARFFASFDNRHERLPSAPALPALFLPEARVQVNGAAPMTVREFLAPRLSLLSERLREFHEWETAQKTHIEGARARRESRYAKHGLLDGQAYGGQGRKWLEFARDSEGRWRIAGLRWQDD